MIHEQKLSQPGVIEVGIVAKGSKNRGGPPHAGRAEKSETASAAEILAGYRPCECVVEE